MQTLNLHHHKTNMTYCTWYLLASASDLHCHITGFVTKITKIRSILKLKSYLTKFFFLWKNIFSFMMASDYWQFRFTGYSVAMDMSMTYIIITVSTVLLNNLFLSLFSFKVRIIFGYIVALIALTIVFFCEIVWHIFNAQTPYSVISIAGASTAIGCAILQSSYFGFASMFPKKYIQAVLVGEGLAGFLAAIAHILIKLTSNSAIWTIIFFLIPTAYIVFSGVLYAKVNYCDSIEL